MGKSWFVLFIIVAVVAVAFLAVGVLATSHRIYSRMGEGSPAYDAPDPVLIREMSFG